MDYIKRNKLTFIIGGSITFILIAFIIMTKRSAKNVERGTLVPFATQEAENTETYKAEPLSNTELGPILEVIDNAVNQSDQETDIVQPLAENQPVEEEQNNEPDTGLPTVGVVYIDDYGFYPKMVKVKSGQNVVFINKGTSPIRLRERKEMNPHINGVTLAPDEMFKTQLFGSGYWAVEDEITGVPIMFTLY